MNRFRQFYIDNGEKLFGYLLRKTGNTALAADLVQESFTRYLERYKDREQSPALLYTIGRNLFYDQVRHDKRSIPSDDIQLQSTANQEESYINREESSRVLGAMAQLKDDERDILALVVASGLSYQEIADIRDCTVANIKVKVHRARHKLKKILQENSHG